MAEAAKIVNVMLENYEHWDKAYGTYRDLYKKHKKAQGLFREMGRSITYHRALAKAGIRKADVAHVIVGDQIGATHNYKGTHPVKVCTDEYCGRRNKPQRGENCHECGNPMASKQVRTSPSDLREKFPKSIVGVTLKDGRHVWFDEPLSNTPWLEIEREIEAENQ